MNASSSLNSESSIAYTLRETSLNPAPLAQGSVSNITRASMVIHPTGRFFDGEIADLTREGALDSDVLINPRRLVGSGTSRADRAAAARREVQSILAQEEAEDPAVIRPQLQLEAELLLQKKDLARHQERAAAASIKIAYAKRLSKKLSEARDNHGFEKNQKKIEALENSKNYHIAAAAEIENILSGVTDDMPGARRVRPAGNYEIESPVKPPILTNPQKKSTSPKNSVVTIPKVRAIPVVEAKAQQPKKNERFLPSASRISNKTVVADSVIPSNTHPTTARYL